MSDPARIPLWTLLLGNFVIGTGVLLPAGMLNPLSAGLGQSVATTGLLITIGGVVVGFGAPLFAAFTSTIDRRLLLAASLILYAAGHGLSAFAPDFTALAILRAVTVVAAAVFTPQAAATVGLIVPPERRASAIAMIFIGWSAASVAGIPAGSLIAEYLGWRAAYGIVAGLSLAAAAAVWAAIRPGLKIAPLSLASWGQVFTNPALVLVIMVTLLSLAGQFVFFGYQAAYFKSVLGATGETIAILFLISGLAGVAGNALAGPAAARIGLDRAGVATTALVLAGTVVAALAGANIAVMTLGLIISGLGSFSGNSLRQSQLAALAPSLASASIALNTSAIYLGQAIGASIGAGLIGEAIGPVLLWAAAAIVAAAVAVAWLLVRPRP